MKRNERVIIVTDWQDKKRAFSSLKRMQVFFPTFKPGTVGKHLREGRTYSSCGLTIERINVNDG